jgi:hypothetical protein
MGNETSTPRRAPLKLVHEIETVAPIKDKIHHRLPPLPVASEALERAVRGKDVRTAYRLLASEPADAVVKIPEAEKRRNSVWLHGDYPLLLIALLGKDEPMIHLLTGAPGGLPETLGRYYQVACAATDHVRTDAGLIISRSSNARQFVTAVDLAVLLGDKAIVEHFLACPETHYSHNTLAIAAFCGHTHLLLPLKDKFSGVDTLYATREFPASPLAIAAGRGFLATVNVLLRFGADANFAILPDGSDTPLAQVVRAQTRWRLKRTDPEYSSEEGIGLRDAPGGAICLFARLHALMGLDIHSRYPAPTRTAYMRIISALVKAGARAENSHIEADSLLMAAAKVQNLPALAELAVCCWQNPEREGGLSPMEVLRENLSRANRITFDYEYEDPEAINYAGIDDETERTERQRVIEGFSVTYEHPQRRQLFERARAEMKEELEKELARRQAEQGTTAASGAGEAY